ncbi:hypothetical protein [Roseomonas harenae]|uniref:hypothetical protein n=1 Tax=Muricoccus harenae TaxID=2692566 RepID=UPI001331C3D0|nr:hypothetical protein [Roseomonas harenae]
MASNVKDQPEDKKPGGHGGRRPGAGRPRGSSNRVKDPPAEVSIAPAQNLTRLTARLDGMVGEGGENLPFLMRYWMRPITAELLEFARELKRMQYLLCEHLRRMANQIAGLEAQLDEQAEMLMAVREEVADARRAGDERAVALQARISALEAEVAGTRQTMEANDRKIDAHFQRVAGTVRTVKSEVPAQAIKEGVLAGTREAVLQAMREGLIPPSLRPDPSRTDGFEAAKSPTRQARAAPRVPGQGLGSMVRPPPPPPFPPRPPVPPKVPEPKARPAAAH